MRPKHPATFFCATVNLKCIFKWTVGLFGSINYSNCFLRGNHMYEMWKARVCEKECWRVWDWSNSPLKIFFKSLERELVMSNNIYAEDFNAPCCPIRCLAFHMEIKVSGWSCSSFSHVADINSTSNGGRKGRFGCQQNMKERSDSGKSRGSVLINLVGTRKVNIKLWERCLLCPLNKERACDWHNKNSADG